VTGILHALVEDAAREAGCPVEQMLGRITPLTISHPKSEIRNKAYLRAVDAGFSREQIARTFKVDRRAVGEGIRKARGAS
jgi:hypothetical protein